MAFEGLSEKLNAAFAKLRGKGRLHESDIKEAMREIRLVLLEADVSYKVVKDFVARVSERAVGQDVLDSLTPAQMVVKIVNEEMTALMGGDVVRLERAKKPPTVIMLCGLQGAGKTTNGAKLAGYMKKQGSRPLLVACDVYRPAAIKQLQIVGEQLGVPVFEEGQGDPVEIARHAVKHALDHGNDLVFLDTAGRLHIDEALMDELRNIKAAVSPTEIILTVDAMTGQDAVFTKLDGDTRGGAALSVRAVTGKPIKFVGTGEKLDKIEPFYPDRMASRILGMGDVLTLIEKAEAAIDEKQALELEQKLRQNRFTLDDFLAQMAQLRSMGSLEDIAAMIPGMNASALKGATIDEKAMPRMEALILSMTPEEREDPSIINSSRKRRIAAGAGQRVEDLNRLLKQFDMMQKMAKQFGNMGGGRRKGKRRGGFASLFGR